MLSTAEKAKVCLDIFTWKCYWYVQLRLLISSILKNENVIQISGTIFGENISLLRKYSRITNIQFSWLKLVPNDFSLVVTKTMIMVITS